MIIITYGFFVPRLRPAQLEEIASFNRVKVYEIPTGFVVGANQATITLKTPFDVLTELSRPVNGITAMLDIVRAEALLPHGLQHGHFVIYREDETDDEELGSPHPHDPTIPHIDE